MMKLFDIINNHKLRKIILGCFSVMILMSISNNVSAEEKLAPTPLYEASGRPLPTGSQVGAAALNNLEYKFGLPAVALWKKVTTGQSFADTFVEQGHRADIRTILADKKVDAYRTNMANQIWRKAKANGNNDEIANAEFEKAMTAIDNGIIKTYYSHITEKTNASANVAREKTLKEMSDKLDKFYADVKQNTDNGMTQTSAIEKAARNDVEVIAAEIQGCPTIEQLKQKYQAGCWSCLVVEKLVSSFLNAASKAYELSQRAGLIVLALGSVMWVLMWGLKNMSSFTQLEPGNILNDLIKFAFKILLAYVFITSGLKAISSYFINPIMGTGAVIAQQFWPDEILAETEDYNWEDDTDLGGLTKEEAQKEIEKKAKLVQEYKAGDEKMKKEVSEMSTMSPEQAEERKQALKKAADEVKLGGVPDFITYPTTGTVSSPFGKRTFSGCKMHAGVDIAAPGGTPIQAAYTGTIVRVGAENPKNIGQGYGLRVYIKHPGNWVTVYAHMSQQVVKINDVVKKGDIIGKTGNTGKNAAYHLHFEIHTPAGRPVDPVGIADGKVNEIDYYGTRDQCGNPYGIAGDKWRGNVSPGITAIPLKGDFTYGGGSSGTSPASMDYSSLVLEPLGEIKYTGKTDILSKSVMNSILGATKVITSTMAETMVLGNAITCFSTQEKGGAWKFGGGWKTLWTTFYITNFWMWIEGAAIWCCGFMLTLAVAYYLLDICFKLAFAVIALPIVMGLWPFNMTKGKFMICISIMFKSAATFAFLAITTSYAMNLISSVLAGDEGGDGLTKMYEALEIGATANEENIKFVADRMAIFGSYFVLLLFAFIYSFKLVGATIPQFVDKFFPDNAFGGASPMHHMATMATKYIKDKAMAPVGLARDVAMHQGGKLAKGAIKGAAVFATGKGSGGTAAGNAVKGVGKGVEAAGKGISAISKAANAIPVAGQAIAAVGNVAGKAVEAAGKVTQAAGSAVNSVNTRNNKPKEKNNDSKK